MNKYEDLAFLDDAEHTITNYIKDFKEWEDDLINYLIECEESHYNYHSRVGIEAMFRHRLHGVDRNDWEDCIGDLRQVSQGRRGLLEQAKAYVNGLKPTDVFRLSGEMKKIDKAVKQLRKLIRLGFRRLIQDLLKEHLGEI